MANPVLDNGVGSPHSVFSSNASPAHDPGTVGRLGDDTFVYGLAGAADLAAGKVTQAAALVANHVNIVATTASVAGQNVMVATLGATLATVGQYNGGKVVVQDDAGEAYTYRIKDHAAVASAGVITLNLYDEIQVDTAAATTLTLHPPTYSGLVIGATAQTGTFTGVARGIVTAAEYGWFQTGGICAVLCDEILTIGNMVTFGSSVAGSVEVLDLLSEAHLGMCVHTSADTEYAAIKLA